MMRKAVEISVSKTKRASRRKCSAFEVVDVEAVTDALETWWLGVGFGEIGVLRTPERTTIVSRCMSS